MARAALGFIGAGNMAEAIARGVLRAGIYQAGELLAADPSAERRRMFSGELGIRAEVDSGIVAANSNVVLLAVKPQMMTAALEQIGPRLAPDTLIITIAAAITAGFIERAVGGEKHPTRVVRVMPNTPMLVGAGMTALAKGRHATEEDLALAERIFGAGSRTVRTTEDKIDIVTALSGSGPAYVFYLVEAMAAGGVKLGLSEADATLMARQTIIGAARLLEESKDAPGELRRKVTSPGGTTQAAIAAFEAGHFFELTAQAMAAAEKRAKELSK